MTDTTISETHAIIPLAVLEAIRRLDLPARDGLEEFHKELAVKRLGMSPTVASQIDRYARLAARGARVDAAEVEALLRLVGRRSDADLVFSDAGRRAGQLAIRTIAASGRFTIKGLPRGVRNRIGFALGRGVLQRVFRVSLVREGGVPAGELLDRLNIQATPTGASCGFYGAAIAEMLRQLTDFDGAMLHVQCRARGGPACHWRAAAANEEEE